MKVRFLAAVPVGLLALVALVGCGGSGGSSATAASPSTTSGGSAHGGGSGGAAMVDVANNPQLGKILVDGQGRTLYLFAKDTSMKSNCMGACAGLWPPDMATGTPKAGNGVNASMLSTIKRSDGTMQVTYGGHPLYTYTADTAPGQVTGNGVNTFGAVWNAVTPAGSATPAGGSSGASSSSGGGSSTQSGGGSTGGYGY